MNKEDFLAGKLFCYKRMSFQFYKYVADPAMMLLTDTNHYQGVIADIYEQGFDIVHVLFGRKTIYFADCTLKGARDE